MTGSGTWKSSVVLAATLGLAMTAGCTSTYRVDDTAGKSLILDAEKRVVLTKRRNGGPHVACAEPYPDLGRATNIDAGLSAGATVPAALLAGLPSGGSV